MTNILTCDKLHMNDNRERRIGMKKIYEEPVLNIEKFQFEQVLGISRDDPITAAPDPFD